MTQPYLTLHDTQEVGNAGFNFFQFGTVEEVRCRNSRHARKLRLANDCRSAHDPPRRSGAVVRSFDCFKPSHFKKSPPRRPSSAVVRSNNTTVPAFRDGRWMDDVHYAS